VDRFTSKQDQNDQRPILHMVQCISPAEVLCFVIFVCNYLAGPCTYGVTVSMTFDVQRNGNDADCTRGILFL